MAGKLVTIANTSNATEAYAIVNRLEDAGIRAFVSDEHVISTDFLLGNAVGWIKVQTAAADAERAIQFLESTDKTVPEAEMPWNVPEDPATPLTPEQAAALEAERKLPPVPETPPTLAEEQVDRAYRIAIMGLALFPPIPHFFAMYLLLKAAFQAPDPTVLSSMRFYTALVISLLAITVMLVILQLILL